MKLSWGAPYYLKRVYKAVSLSDRNTERLLKLISRNALSFLETQEFIGNLVTQNRGHFVGRPGSTESVGMRHFWRTRLSRLPGRPQSDYPHFFRQNALRYSGISGEPNETFDYFSYRYLEASLSANLFSFGEFAPDALPIAHIRSRTGLANTELSNLEPWKCIEAESEPWTISLAGRKVLVVHPFVETIRRQHERLGRIQGVKEVMPDFALSLIRPPTTTSPNSPGWIESFRKLCDAVEDVNFDVALVGAGSYGLPLAKFISTLGKPSVHLGGSLQLFFGIRGARWDSGRLVSSLIDSSWVSVRDEDLFDGLRSIEGGSYH